MSATITNWPLTLEQFLSLPEAEPALKMGCAGEISQKASPTFKHALLQREIAARLEAYAAPRRAGHSVTEQRVILGRVARVLDVALIDFLAPDYSEHRALEAADESPESGADF